MHDILIIKAAYDVGNGVGLSDISEELVTETFALGCAGNQASDIDKFHTSWNNALRFNDLS
jgi:hypothetical protein